MYSETLIPKDKIVKFRSVTGKISNRTYNREIEQARERANDDFCEIDLPRLPWVQIQADENEFEDIIHILRTYHNDQLMLLYNKLVKLLGTSSNQLNINNFDLKNNNCTMCNKNVQTKSSVMTIITKNNKKDIKLFCSLACKIDYEGS